MALKNKYQREKQQYSNDSGRTWIDVSPANYRRGRLIEAGSEDCNTVEWKEVTGSWFCVDAEPITKWVTVSGEFLCDTGNKYAKEKEQVSEDGGMTWTDTGNTRKGSLIKTDSPGCISYRWVEMKNNYICLGNNKHVREKRQYSNDGGKTWTDVSPIETRQGDIIEANSAYCGYVPPTPGDYENQYLTFEAIEDGTFTFTGRNSNSLSYSLDDGQTWTALASGSASPTVTAGNKIMWKGTCTPSDTGIGKFSSTGTFNAYGNTMSIVHGDNFQNSTTISGNQFTSLFNNTKVVNAENLVLPATTLASWCYSYMFSGCTRLVNTPTLPAETLKTGCYQGMFNGCTSLTTVPSVLPATKLADYCYYQMFYGCTSLTSAPTLPATTLKTECYYQMFRGCEGMTSAPVLPATTLVSSCYYGMFLGCSSLSYIKCLATNISATNCTSNWVANVASTGTFIKASSMTSWTTGNNGIPTGWTVQNA